MSLGCDLNMAYGEIDELKKELEETQKALGLLSGKYEALQQLVERDRKHQRFEAAKAAMQGILANPCHAALGSADMAGTAVICADALLAALEEG